MHVCMYMCKALGLVSRYGVEAAKRNLAHIIKISRMEH